MAEMFQRTNRRTLLQKGGVFLAGVLGLKLADKNAMAETAVPASVKGETIRFFTRMAQVPSHGFSPGKISAVRSNRLITQGELFDAPEGKKVGEFYSTCFCLGTQHGPNPNAASNIELQTFRLAEGTIFGAAAESDANGIKTHAILGGTGRYIGARGQFCAVPAASGVEIVLTLLT